MIVYRPRLTPRQRRAQRLAADERAYTIALAERAQRACYDEEDEDPVFEARTRAYKALIAEALELPTEELTNG